ncbi:hypothetical protein ES703_108063 [subsurface metagenome]
MSRPLKHPARPGHQGKQVARPRQILGLGIRIEKNLERLPAILCGNAGGGVLDGVHADGKGRLMEGGVPVHHGGQPQLLGPFFGKRHTDKTPPLTHHEVDVFRAGLLRQHDKITLILTVLIVRHDDHLAGPQVVQDTFHRFKHG